MTDKCLKSAIIARYSAVMSETVQHTTKVTIAQNRIRHFDRHQTC